MSEDAPGGPVAKPAKGGVPLSLRRKSKARLAAVQCLYRVTLSHASLSAATLEKDYFEHWDADQALSAPVISGDTLPDKPLLRRLLSGVVEDWAMLEARLTALLAGHMERARLSPLLQAILLCGLYELKASPQLAPPVLIHEYVTLTNRFFEAGEAGLVNKVLEMAAQPHAPV